MAIKLALISPCHSTSLLPLCFFKKISKGPLSFKGLVEGREAAEEGDAGYEAWLRDTGAVEGARGTVRQREDGTYEAVYKIWYDFKPENHDDPLMLSLSVGEGE